MNLTENMYADIKAQLPALQEALKQGIKWGNDIAIRYIHYDLVIHIMYLSIGGGILFYIIYFLIKTIRKEFHKDSPDEDIYYPLVMMLVIVGIVEIIFTSINLEIVLKDIFIPEIRIIELLSNLIKEI